MRERGYGLTLPDGAFLVERTSDGLADRADGTVRSELRSDGSVL